MRSVEIHVEIRESVEMVILLIKEDLICSESSALTLREKPSDMVSTAISGIVAIVALDFSMDMS